MVEYNKDRPLKVATAFSGYDSQKMALERLHKAFPDFCFELVAWSEIDENAIAAHNAIFPEDKSKNLGDISKIDWAKAPDFDLFTMSSPCQDFSMIGKRRGGEEGSGTRSSLLWECTKAIEIKRPKYILFENVKGLISGTFLKGFHKWQSRLHKFGYENFTQVLNASSYNVPQNRERVFMISILRTDSEPNPSFYFPKKMKLERRIKDILEPNVDESFYLSDKALEYFCRVNNDKSHGHNDGFGITGVMEEIEPKIVGYSRDSETGKVKSRHLKDLANTITTCTGSGNNCDQYVAEPKIAASRGRGKGWQQQLEINDSGTSNTITSVNKDNLLIEPNVLRAERTEQCKQLRKMNGDKGMKFNQGNKEYSPRTEGVSNTLSTSTKDNMLAMPELRMVDGCMVDKEGRKYRIRKLTPTECFRLQDVSDEDIEKMKQAGIAKTNLHKLAGNSIVVACMFHIFRKLFVEKGNENPQLELF